MHNVCVLFVSAYNREEPRDKDKSPEHTGKWSEKARVHKVNKQKPKNSYTELFPSLLFFFN